MKNPTLVVLPLLLYVLPACSQPFDQAKLDAYFDTLAANDRFMGSIAVSKGGKSIYAKSLGYLDLESKKRADANTKYRIGSITKTFTVALVFKAIEENKLSLQQTIEVFFPNLPNASKITVSNLLNHRSGIHNITSNPDYLSWNTQPRSEAELTAIISASGSDFEPDTKASYSNSNYVLLTYVLEKVFEKPYGILLKQYITEPLGLTNTSLGGPIAPANNEAMSYKADDGWIKESETDSSIPVGAGAIISTPTDIVAFGEALFGGRVISAANVERMKTLRDGYGMGLFEIPFHDKKAFGHSGGIDGFTSTWGYFPDEQVSLAITSNGSGVRTNDVAIAVLSAIFDKPFDIPTFGKYELEAAAIPAYLGIYSSSQLPIKITVTHSGNTVIAQATGQPSFPLEPTAKDKFTFDKAGVVMEFNPTANTFVLKQGGGEFTFTKE